MNHVSLPRLRRAGAASLLALATIAGCGPRASEPPAAPAASDPAATVPESYPIRMIFVAYVKDPKAPPRTEAEAVARANEALAKLRAPGASFEAVAREMSDDAMSAADGGWFGFVADWTGAADAPLVKAARALKVGEISAPFAGPSGQQVIQRLSRDEGRALEAKNVIPVEGVLAPWHDLEKSLPVTQTKEAAYEEAAKVVVALRSGAYDIGAASGKLLAAVPVSMPVRRGSTGALRELVEGPRALAVGDISDPIDTPGGWFIAKRLPYVRCYARHLVITSSSSPASIKPNKRTPAAARQLAQEALDRLRREPGAWNELARKVSEEPASKDIGGFVGDLANTVPSNRRATAPEFEAAVGNLKPGETSDLVDTRFGVHIFHRDD
jgi:parvulin-like peptidyl-prolyl isomerase